MTTDLFTSGYRQDPYWWETVNQSDPAPAPTLPGRADVVIIGSGYTGLCAALVAVRAGRETVILEAETAGWGCSTRNGGLIGNDLKPDFGKLTRKYGAETAQAILAEGPASLAWIKDFVAREALDCDFLVPGRFLGAHTPRQFERLKQEIATEPRAGAEPSYPVDRVEMRKFIDTDFYHGGIVHPDHASLNPAKFHNTLLKKAISEGATIIPHCRATKMTEDGHRQVVETSQGRIVADNLIVATNGYTDDAAPWHKRRIIPIGSYIIATEPLEEALMDRLFPTDAVICDTRKVVYYYRPSPDRRRIIFGGRVTGGETDPNRAAPLLHRDLVELFPDLAATRISHAWMGTVAYTFDEMPHLGRNRGRHYAMGYCGSGVAMAAYLGTKIARQMLRLPDAKTGLDPVSFRTRPFYSGRPWFMPALVSYYRLRDRLAR